MTGQLYASVEDLADILCISQGDPRWGLLADKLDAASRWVERETGHVFYTTTLSEARYFTAEWTSSQWLAGERVPYWASQRRGSGLEEIEVDEFLSLSELATDQNGDGVYETVWTVGTDYWLGPRNAPQKGRPYNRIHRNAVSGRYLFPLFENAVRPTGKFGYCLTTPAAIRDLSLAAAEILARPILDLAIAGVQTYKFGSDVSVVMSSASLPALAQSILDSYRNESLAFA